MTEPKTEPQKKTLDQIVNDTLSSNFGISDEDLQSLFDDSVVEPTTNPTSAIATPTVEPATPTPPATEPTVTAASTEVIPPVVSPPEPLPDKSKDLENSLKTANDQIAQLLMAVKELERKSQATGPKPVKPQVDPTADIDDQAIIAAPKESIVKLMKAMLKDALPAAFTEYDTIRSTRDLVDKFRSEHSDFDELRSIMRQIVSENPASNDNPAALPRVYEEAKRRKIAALELMKKELNLPASTGSEPALSTPRLSEEEILAKLEKRLVENIRKRRNASVPLASTQSAPVSPIDRMAPRDATKPITEEEKMFEEMLTSGPSSTNFLRGLDLVAKK